MKNVIKGKRKNNSIQNFAVDELIKKTRGFVEPDVIKEKVSKHLHKGIYLVSSEELLSVQTNQSVKGVYDNIYETILLDEEWYNKAPDIAIHEVAHAYLNDECKSVIYVDGREIKYGIGLEEGGVSILQKVASIDDIDDCDVNSYFFQAQIFKQLNTLYKYTKSKKYNNLLEHLLKEPSDFISAIYRIYYDILCTTNIDKADIDSLSYKCAGVIINSTDAMVDDTENDYRLIYTICGSINTVFLSLADEKIRNGEISNPLFPKFNGSCITSEERLLNLIFGTDVLDNYYTRQYELLNGCLAMYVNEMDSLDISDIKGYTYKKV